MEATQTELQKKAEEALSFFTQKTRGNGEKFWSMVNEPDWVHRLAFDAHDGMLPDDWKYAFIVEALRTISEAEDPEEAEYEIEADIYTSDLFAWVASNLNREGYVDEAVSSMGWPKAGLSQAIAYGQIEEKREVYRFVLEALRKQVEE